MHMTAEGMCGKNTYQYTTRVYSIRDLLGKLRVPQLVKKFPAFRGNRGSTNVITSARLVLTLSQMNQVHIFPPYFSKIHSNIKLSTSITSSVFFHSGFPIKIFVPHLFHDRSISFCMIL